MAGVDPKPKQSGNPNLLASPLPEGYCSVLVKLIDEVSNDHVKLRRLVYALAWHSLKPEFVAATSPPSVVNDARSWLELERALEFENLVKRVESYVAQRSPNLIGIAGHSDLIQQDRFRYGQSTSVGNERLARSTETAATELELVPTNRELVPIDNAIIVAPEKPPSWVALRSVNDSDQRWLGTGASFAFNSATETSPQNRLPRWSFFHLVAAATVGVALYAGLTGWINLAREPAPYPVRPPEQPNSLLNQYTPRFDSSNFPNRFESPALSPFPLPKTYGVFVASNGQLFELEPLPIKIPDPRVLMSAEITKPSRTTVHGGSLDFVVFRRELANSAPQTATVRVVARVVRTIKFVDGKATVIPAQDSWRVRSKSYEFKVSPVENQREMIALKPNNDAQIPAGRYALVLNGIGYEFTVDGPINALEQCLEQIEAINGLVLSECRKL